jgi:hypothetical protein
MASKKTVQFKSQKEAVWYAMDTLGWERGSQMRCPELEKYAHQFFVGSGKFSNVSMLRDQWCKSKGYDSAKVQTMPAGFFSRMN